jgi:RND superfamily putative drug exporter
MFRWLARFAVRHRWAVLIAWVALVAVAAPFALRAQDPLKVGGFSSNDTEAARGRIAIEQRLDYSPSTLIIVYESDTLRASDPRFLDQVAASLARVPALPFVEDVILPTVDPSLISRSGRIAYAIVGLDLPPEQAQRDVPEFQAAMAPQPDVDYLIAGGPAFYADIETASQRDLRRAEIIALPVALLALLVVFGTVVSAMVPLVTGAAGVAVVLMAIFWLAHAADLSIFVLNLATMLGLGLAVDYALFITSRYREELHRNGGDVAAAIERAVDTAGRAVFFSGMSVLIGLAGLMLFPLMFLRSVGIAGVVVVAISTFTSLTLLPALLAVLGPRVESLGLGRLHGVAVGGDRPDEHGGWYRLAHLVMRHPVIIAVATLSILIALGLPFRHANISSPDATILPEDLPSRQGFDLLSSEFSGGEISPFLIVFEFADDVPDAERVALVDRFETLLGRDDRIERVQGPTAYLDALEGLPPEARFRARELLEAGGVDTQLRRFWSDDAAVIFAYPEKPANDPQNKALLAQLRSIPDTPEVTVLVTGGTAEIVDVVDQIYDRFWLAGGFVVVMTYTVLLILFRSVVLPLKAIFLNVMSILASYGALVWVFQDGHMHELLRFTPQGFVEASLPVIMFCVLFGLSMDYEVFLLTRIREEWDRTGDNRESVAYGLERSGRIITSAALIVVVVTGSFVSADVVIVKALGLGIAIAVAVDATIVRALLVPATMALLGHVNWWMPAWLDRFLPGTGFHE